MKPLSTNKCKHSGKYTDLMSNNENKYSDVAAGKKFMQIFRQVFGVDDNSA